MLLKGAIRPLESNSGPGFYSRLFLVPKKTGDMRPVIDLSDLNKFVECPTFKMDTAELVRMDLQPGMWVTSIDLKDAYFHIPINKSHWKYLRFRVLGKVYYFIALPFGLSTAPRLFTKIAKQVKKMALKRGIYIHQYIDDWLNRALSKLECSQNTQVLIELIEELGWIINYPKSELEPTQDTNFLSYRFQLMKGIVLPTGKRIQDLQGSILPFLTSQESTPRKLMSIIGLIESTVRQVPQGRLRLRTYPARIGQCVEMGSVFGQTRKHFPTNTYSPKVVDTDRESPSGSTSAPSSTQSSHLYRCVSTGMGCPLSTPFCQGSMGRCGVQTTHQCFGDEGSFKRPQSLQNVPSQLLCPGSHRQHDCGCIHKQGGRYQVMGSVCPHLANTDMVQNQSHCLNCETCSWLHQYTCGPTLSQGSTDPHRVVVTSASFPSDLSNRGNTTHRSICHQVQSQTPFVCVASSRPFVSAGGCNVDGLDRERLLRLSTIGFDSTVDEQAAQTPVQNAPNSSSMAHENVVPRTHATSMERTLEVATDSRSLKAAFEPNLSRKHSGAKSPCLVDQGRSPDVERELEIKQQISNPQRESTQRIYLSKFLIFSKWCDENAVSSLCPTTENISMFFLHLFKDRKLDPVTIQGYRSAIANQLYGKVRWDISHDPSLNRLIDSFFRDKPKICRNIPPWDLQVLLKALTRAPFEPLALAPLKWVTFKMPFSNNDPGRTLGISGGIRVPVMKSRM